MQSPPRYVVTYDISCSFAVAVMDEEIGVHGVEAAAKGRRKMTSKGEEKDDVAKL